ncbi:hypothetical protein LGL08_17515 [Clostridium estertheticum]|uniref:hypothetical protein n=1 Tax=Clostridium estertheticum TaxID=238834 RepID=UPI001CF505B0|nr:hypothetical protein [Clostridium estertheticum]MCB2307941.1 hypothetical protein [Clostridium estertheticum]MCB2346065.1 hypothetical protein [Clostridium estertheticum]MCB2351323.1 hypothetical protein [Clostridium estertheticum]WAG44210.1 hypothetical protein LL127_11535 [Clostridium estertheticum]
MFKLVKYELRANFLTIVGICITVIVASLLLMTQKGTWSSTTIIALSGCLIIGSVIVIFIASLKIMSKYLHNDSGYLLFTLPQSGKSIITSRLITALIQISIIVGVSFLMSYLTLTDKIDFSFLENIKPGLILYSIINYVWGIIYFLTIIYFCMVIGKIALKGKKLGKIGSFVIFIILSIVISWLSTKITNLLPQNLNLSDFSINTANALDFGTTASESAFNINIAAAIFDIIVFIGLFMGTSYLIDKKLDL